MFIEWSRSVGWTIVRRGEFVLASWLVWYSEGMYDIS